MSIDAKVFNTIAEWAKMPPDKLKEEGGIKLAVDLKRCRTAADEMKEIILPGANKEFRTLYEIEGRPNKLTTIPGAMLTPYTPGGKYKYPQDIVDMERELKKKKAQAVKDGSAVNVGGDPDPAKVQLYRIELIS